MLLDNTEILRLKMKRKTKIYNIVLPLICILACVLYVQINVRAEEYEYDENGRVIFVIHDDGSCTEYEYDSNGNIISVMTTDIKDYDTNTENIVEEKNEDKSNKSDSIGNDKETSYDDSINYTDTELNDNQSNIKSDNSSKDSSDNSNVAKPEDISGNDTSLPDVDSTDSQNNSLDSQNSKGNKDNSLEKGVGDDKSQKSTDALTERNSILTGDNSLVIPVVITMIISLFMVLIVLKLKNKDRMDLDNEK